MMPRRTAAAAAFAARPLQNKMSHDFGGQIIPEAAKSHRVMAYLFNGYWEDIGTIESFFNANLALTHNVRAGGRAAPPLLLLSAAQCCVLSRCSCACAASHS